MNIENSGEVKSAVRVLEILEFLGRAHKPVTLKAIVAELGYPKSSTFNLLATLVARAYVVLRPGAEVPYRAKARQPARA